MIQGHFSWVLFLGSYARLGQKRDPVTGISGLGLTVNHAMRAESLFCPKFTTAAAFVQDMKIVGTRLMQTADCMLNILQRYIPSLLTRHRLTI